MAKEVKLTPEALKKLQDELSELKNVRVDQVAQQLKEARSFGDLSENSEYDAAKDEQGKVFSRIAEIQAMLDNYILVEDAPVDGDTIHIGSVVTVLDLEFEESDRYEIVVSQEADLAHNRISEESPFGRAMLGHRVDDEVVVEAPAGPVYYRILSVE